ncbi:hypothetical protein TcasGA2_TC013902 [Tribolium castaneum]|uniref:Uncharacterized protein n=1 Tax=Tribolium castaneum TaxID=7070 RepID=D6WMP0_TRICA|nr:hypothetical protein TcasGA2_TC013902 [Tribolium castaneum]
MKMEVFDDIWKQENRTSNTVPGNCGNTKSTKKRFTRTFALELEEYFFMKLDLPAAQFLVLSPVGSIEIILKIIFHCWSRLQVIYLVNFLEVATTIFEEKLQTYLM